MIAAAQIGFLLIRRAFQMPVELMAEASSKKNFYMRF